MTLVMSDINSVATLCKWDDPLYSSERLEMWRVFSSFISPDAHQPKRKSGLRSHSVHCFQPVHCQHNGTTDLYNKGGGSVQ